MNTLDASLDQLTFTHWNKRMDEHPNEVGLLTPIWLINAGANAYQRVIDAGNHPYFKLDDFNTKTT